MEEEIVRLRKRLEEEGLDAGAHTIAYHLTRFALFIGSRPELSHLRTTYRSPQTHGVIERFFRSIKYEHLYREEIPSGQDLVDVFRSLYSQVRPHDHLDFRTPLDPSWSLQSPTYSAPKVSRKVDSGHSATSICAGQM